MVFVIFEFYYINIEREDKEPTSCVSDIGHNCHSVTLYYINFIQLTTL